MKKVIFSFLFLVVIMPLHAQNYDISVTIQNIKEIKGHIQIGLYNNPEEFPKVGKEYKRFYFKVDSHRMTYRIPNLNKGKYAIATYHDINSDKECNTNFFGYPTEDFGFSNNVKIFIAPPSFNSALIELDSNTSIEIEID